MRTVLRQLKRILLGLLPLAVLKRLAPRAVIGVFYHSVSDERMPHVEHLYPPLSAAQFEHALLYLKQRYTLVDYHQLHAHVFDGVPLPPNAAHLSFDDGFLECYTVVRPLLLKHGVPCIFFITTDWIDNAGMFYRNKVSLAIEQVAAMERDARSMVFTAINHAFDTHIKSAEAFTAWIKPLARDDEATIDMVCKMLGIDTRERLDAQPYYMSSAQLLELHNDGFVLGSHTRTHPKLSGIDAAQREAEIVQSSQVVQKLTGQPIVPFSFPYSGSGLDRAELADLRTRHDYLGLLFDTKGLHVDRRFIVNRMWGEKPEYAHVDGRTNLPRVLRGAYLDELGG